MGVFRDSKQVILGVLFFAFVAWSVYGAAATIETYAFRMVHVAFILVLGFLTLPFSPKANKWLNRVDIVLALLGIAAIVYSLYDLDQFIRRSTLPETWDMVFGILTILMLVELSRRTVGTAFTLVLVGFLLYACLGNYIPGPLAHKGYDLDRIVGHMTMTLEGVFGVPISVSVSFVMLFVVYGVFMDAAGAGRFWLDMSLSVMGRSSASAGRGAVVTTALLGGPQASGVATTMSVTPIMWPILRQAGYTPDMAAGLISAGGIGAVISPPLMGAGAFLIMQFLKISFWDVVVMVSMPTLLYYIGTLVMVELEARKMHFNPPKEVAQPVWQVLRKQGYHLISLVVLIALLVGWNLSPEMAALGAIATTIAASFLSKDREEWLLPKKIVLATIDGARNMLPVAVLLAAAGLIVGVFSLTGLGLKISTIIMSLSGGSIIIALFLALFTSFVIGLSLPITATYIMTVVMVAPALVKVGVPDYVAHLLAFYFAVLSEVSPPVGLSPSAAAAVTGGNPFGSMMQAWKYSLPAFLVPFLFAATQEGANLLIIGATLPGFIQAVLNSSFSLFFLSLGIVAYFRGPLNVFERAILIIIAVFMVIKVIDFSLVGLVPVGIGMVVVIRNWMVHRTVAGSVTA
ncbi:MAG: TRAP transporter fused permease subunit [Desulforhopalus sp.]|nr:TRAP transporter fused permease subunit [Desulforhopalus sp.]